MGLVFRDRRICHQLKECVYEYDFLLVVNSNLGRISHGFGATATYLSTRGSAIAEEPRDALRQLKYYGRFLTELLTRSSANPEEPCEHTVS